jgi:hypothetical protein
MENVILVNCTPHSLVFELPDGTIMELEPSGIIPRCVPVFKDAGMINGIPLHNTTLIDVENMPEPTPNTIYIVSSFVAQALSYRLDVLAPNTSPSMVVRDEKGNIIRVKGLQKF